MEPGVPRHSCPRVEAPQLRPHWSLLTRSCGAGRDGVTLPAQRTTFQSLGCKVVCGWELFRQPQPSVLEKKPLNQSGSSGSPTLTQMASDWAMHTQGGGGIGGV